MIIQRLSNDDIARLLPLLNPAKVEEVILELDAAVQKSTDLPSLRKAMASSLEDAALYVSACGTGYRLAARTGPTGICLVGRDPKVTPKAPSKKKE